MKTQLKIYKDLFGWMPFVLSIPLNFFMVTGSFPMAIFYSLGGIASVLALIFNIWFVVMLCEEDGGVSGTMNGY